ncbi:MAG: hypothetical protein HBSAPP03_27640 [Phycisphaerae bacterium]|nr:MAG: hypothetical protein HBSAPP03_27640 [Phycisphaerae bacterium]
MLSSLLAVSLTLAAPGNTADCPAAFGKEKIQDPPKVAVIAGKPVAVEDLGSALMETAGATVLEEAVLDAALVELLDRRGLAVSASDIDAERRGMIEVFIGEAAVSPAQAGELLEHLRRGRGLGPTRYEALLWRNAALRKLVAPLAEPSREDQETVQAMDFGPTCRLRVLTTEREADAVSIRARLMSVGEDALLAMRFAAEAVDHSTDVSAAAGGLLARANLADPSLPAVVRAAARELPIGKLSVVLSTERGYALVLVESRTPGREPSAAEKSRTLERLRRRMERQAMDRLARELLDAARPIVLDPSLKWSWDHPPR